MKQLGYTEKEQPVEGRPDPFIGGIAIGGNPPDFIDDKALTAGEHPDNSDGDWDGDNPSMPTAVPFANGVDVRK